MSDKEKPTTTLRLALAGPGALLQASYPLTLKLQWLLSDQRALALRYLGM